MRNSDDLGLSKSKISKVYFESAEGTVALDVFLASPASDSVNTPIDIKSQMKAHGLSLLEISTTLRKWARHQSGVEKMTINYIGGRYSLAIILKELTENRMHDIHCDEAELSRPFNGYIPLIYILGPAQKHSTIVNSIDSYSVI